MEESALNSWMRREGEESWGSVAREKRRESNEAKTGRVGTVCSVSEDKERVSGSDAVGGLADEESEEDGS